MDLATSKSKNNTFPASPHYLSLCVSTLKAQNPQNPNNTDYWTGVADPLADDDYLDNHGGSLLEYTTTCGIEQTFQHFKNCVDFLFLKERKGIDMILDDTDGGLYQLRTVLVPILDPFSTADLEQTSDRLKMQGCDEWNPWNPACEDSSWYGGYNMVHNPSICPETSSDDWKQQEANDQLCVELPPFSDCAEHCAYWTAFNDTTYVDSLAAGELKDNLTAVLLLSDSNNDDVYGYDDGYGYQAANVGAICARFAEALKAATLDCADGNTSDATIGSEDLVGLNVDCDDLLALDEAHVAALTTLGAAQATISLTIDIAADLSQATVAELATIKTTIATQVATTTGIDFSGVTTTLQQGSLNLRRSFDHVTVTFTFPLGAVVDLEAANTAVATAVASNAGFTVTIVVGGMSTTSEKITVESFQSDAGVVSKTSGATRAIGSLVGTALLVWCM
jgi:hypothetical protein